MAGDRTTPAETVTRKPDDAVGSPGPAPAGGGKQTPEQAAITATGSGGRSDTERQSAWHGSEPGRSPQASGGASQGHADQKAAGDGGSAKSAQGHYKVEKERG